jgi:hypothetical protein
LYEYLLGRIISDQMTTERSDTGVTFNLVLEGMVGFQYAVLEEKGIQGRRRI